jgi:hypothetical protein
MLLLMPTCPRTGSDSTGVAEAVVDCKTPHFLPAPADPQILARRQASWLIGASSLQVALGGSV